MMEVVEEVRGVVKKFYLDFLTQLSTPPRLTYAVDELGPRTFEFDGRPHERVDFSCENERGFELVASLWRRRSEEGSARRPAGVVLYVHDFLDCRATVVDVLAPVLAAGFACRAFDCTACGSARNDGSSFLSASGNHQRSSSSVGAA